VIRRKFEARISHRGGGRDTLRDTEVYEVWKFMEVGGPVGGFTRREVTEMETFHGIEEDASAWRSEPRAPGRVLGVVVSTCEEALAEGGVI
jgi:hypothetical protein